MDISVERGYRPPPPPSAASGDDRHPHHQQASGDDHHPRHRRAYDHRYWSGVGRSYCSWGVTSFLIDLPYITHPQAAKQDAKLWLLTKKWEQEATPLNVFPVVISFSQDALVLRQIPKRVNTLKE